MSEKSGLSDKHEKMQFLETPAMPRIIGTYADGHEAPRKAPKPQTVVPRRSDRIVKKIMAAYFQAGIN